MLQSRLPVGGVAPARCPVGGGTAHWLTRMLSSCVALAMLSRLDALPVEPLPFFLAPKSTMMGGDGSAPAALGP